MREGAGLGEGEKLGEGGLFEGEGRWGKGMRWKSRRGAGREGRERERR